ncbi:MAG: hypothetical protein CMJ83_09315 [Planctomycetes bacterium]|nr:hypothetical protein [Planctomycetota bacterium]
MKTLPLAILVTMCLCASVCAQGNPGPDIIVGDLPGIQNYTPAGGFHAYSVGTTSCNIGTANANWVANTVDHPVIAQQLYRVRDGVFEQVGHSWLKHGFVALTGNLCQTCNGQGGSVLGVGCSDPYGAGLNGSQNSLGPRFEVNPYSGLFVMPHGSATITDSTSARLRVPSSKVMNQPAGTRFFIEGQYVAKDDANVGNHFNNAAWRECTSTASGSLSLTGLTMREEEAVFAWKAMDPTVQIATLNIPGEGRFYVGFNVIPISASVNRYVYTLSNVNSDLAAGSFSVAMPNGAVIQNQTFLDADYHSGSVWQSTDWPGTASATSVSWTTPTPFTVNANGPALRWASTHTFTFESDAMPGDITVGLFKNSNTYTVSGFTIPTPDWQINQPQASMDVNGLTNNAFLGPIQAVVNTGASATWNYGSNVSSIGSMFNVYYHLGNGVSSGITLVDGQIVNLNVASPTLAPAFPALQPTIASASVPFTAPNVALDLTMQMMVTDVASLSGVWLSAATELDIVTCSANTVLHSLGDDDSVAVPLGVGTDHECVTSVAFYGTTYTTLFVNSNGSVSFNTGSSDFTASSSEFLQEMPRAAGHWSDLNPSSGGSGTVSSSSTTAGVLRVTFANVTEWSQNATVNFEVAFYPNGNVGIENHQINSGPWVGTTIVGFSPGNNATGSVVDLSSLVGSSTSYPLGNAVYEIGTQVTGFTSATLDPLNNLTVN